MMNISSSFDLGAAVDSQIGPSAGKKNEAAYRKVINLVIGGVGERFNPPVLKTGAHFVGREFKSRPLRHYFKQSR